MGKPSITVATEEGVPGMRISIAVMQPPEIPPTKTATKRLMPICGGMVKVKGMSKATAMAAVRPGIMPMIMPPSTPAKMSDRVVRFITIDKACEMAPQSKLRDDTSSLQQAGRENQVQAQLKHGVYSQCS